VAEELLDASAGLRILATSREPLRIAGEQVRSLAPLAVPTVLSEDLDELTAYASVALFLERARAAVPGLELTAANAPAVAQICRRLDGIPLALELAAVRSSSMGLDSLAQRLASGLDLLIARGRSRPERHQTMRAVLEWSHELLNAEEQLVLRRLGVFPGSWTLDAAEFVCADGGTNVALAIGDLVDKSLVVMEVAGGDARYRLLAPVREYAAGRLAASGEFELVRDRHRAFFVALSKRSALEVHRPDQGAWIRRLDAELDNLRFAVRNCQVQTDPESVLWIAGGLWWYLWQRGHLREGLRWVEPALARTDVAVPARIAGLRSAGMLRGALGDHEQAITYATQMRDLAEEAGDDAQLSIAHTLLGLERLRQGDPQGARPYFEDALAMARSADDQDLVANGLVHLGAVVAEQDPAHAESLFRNGLAVFEAIGDRWGVAYASNYLARLLLSSADFSGAAELSGRAAGLLDELGDRFYLIFTLEDFARAVTGLGRPQTAARLLGASDAIRRATGALLSPGSHDEYDATVAELESALGPERFRRARQAGATTSIQSLLVEAAEPELAPTSRQGRDANTLAGPGGVLTRREVDVARLLAAGRSNREIATELVIALGTAGIHVEHILRKLDLRSRHQVADWGRERGLIA
jgi:predicted ATPase/DNA-binding CsgD family transcriptional regulator